jgi:hypothetical protein
VCYSPVHLSGLLIGQEPPDTQEGGERTLARHTSLIDEALSFLEAPPEQLGGRLRPD